MAITEPSGLTTVDAGTDDAHEDYDQNITRLNAMQVRYIRALVGEAGGVSKHDQVYIKPADGKFYLAQATSDLTKMPSAGFIEEGKPQGEYAKAIWSGKITDTGWSLTPGDVLILDRDTPGVFSYLADELDRDEAAFSVQQVLGFVVETDAIFVWIQRPFIFTNGIAKALAFDPSTEVPSGYGNRGVLNCENVDGTLELVWYDNGGQRTQITSGGRLSVGIEAQIEGDYGWLACERLQFASGTLVQVEPGVLLYTPPAGGNGGGPSFMQFVLMAAATMYTHSNMGTTYSELLPPKNAQLVPNTRIKIDISDWTSCRVQGLIYNANDMSETNYIKLQYSLDYTAWVDLTPECTWTDEDIEDPTDPGMFVGAWGAIPSGAKGQEIYIRAMAKVPGDAGDDLRVWKIYLDVKTT